MRPKRGPNQLTFDGTIKYLVVRFQVVGNKLFPQKNTNNQQTTTALRQPRYKPQQTTIFEYSNQRISKRCNICQVSCYHRTWKRN